MRVWGLHPTAAWARNQSLRSRDHLSVGLQGCRAASIYFGGHVSCYPRLVSKLPS